MAKSTGLSLYTDIQEVADLVLAHRGGDYECNSYSAAVHFTHRFYKFRKLYREVYGEPCKYDTIIARRVEKDTKVVRFRIRQHVGVFTPVGGSVAELSTTDDLFDVAEALAKKLKGEE